MRIFSILLILTFTLVQNTYGRTFSDESKASLVNKFRQKFQTYLNNEFELNEFKRGEIIYI